MRSGFGRVNNRANFLLQASNAIFYGPNASFHYGNEAIPGAPQDLNNSITFQKPADVQANLNQAKVRRVATPFHPKKPLVTLEAVDEDDAEDERQRSRVKRIATPYHPKKPLVALEAADNGAEHERQQSRVKRIATPYHPRAAGTDDSEQAAVRRVATPYHRGVTSTDSAASAASAVSGASSSSSGATSSAAASPRGPGASGDSAPQPLKSGYTRVTGGADFLLNASQAMHYGPNASFHWSRSKAAGRAAPPALNADEDEKQGPAAVPTYRVLAKRPIQLADRIQFKKPVSSGAAGDSPLKVQKSVLPMDRPSQWTAVSASHDGHAHSDNVGSSGSSSGSESFSSDDESTASSTFGKLKSFFRTFTFGKKKVGKKKKKQGNPRWFRLRARLMW